MTVDDLYGPDGTPLIGRWPLDMCIEHAREADHADAPYNSHLLAALRAVELLTAERDDLAGADSRRYRQYAVQVPGEASVRPIGFVRKLTGYRRDDLAETHPDAYVVTRLHTEHDELWQEVTGDGR